MKMQRIEIRIKSEIKRIIQTAANITDLTLTDFVIKAALLEAQRFINDYHETISQINELKKLSKKLKHRP